MNKLKFTDRVVNIAASENNPHKRGFFVKEGYRTGRLNTGKYYEITDGKGDFWHSSPEVIQKEESNHEL